MNKHLLVLLVFLSNIGYSKLNNSILLMNPRDRHILFVSIKEVADAYYNNKQNKKSEEFYRAALEIYPIGDEAHQLANQLQITLDDQQTYSNFMQWGDEAITVSKYNEAIAHYLMAAELLSSGELYAKLADAYQKSGDTENTDFYAQLSQNTVNKNNEETIEYNYESLDSNTPEYQDAIEEVIEYNTIEDEVFDDDFDDAIIEKHLDHEIMP